MTLALITAVYGGYDRVYDLPDDHGFDDAVCVTDGASEVGSGWRVVIEQRNVHPRLAAKYPKMRPYDYTNCDSAVWLDASFHITDVRFSQWAREHLAKHDFVVWQHPEGRIDFIDEAEVCQDWPKYRDYKIREQCAHYLKQGMPRGWGLFACGTIGYNFTDEVRAFSAEWLVHQYVWSVQDQVSLPFLLWKTGMPFGVWGANEYNNPFVQLHWQERRGEVGE